MLRLAFVFFICETAFTVLGASSSYAQTIANDKERHGANIVSSFSEDQVFFLEKRTEFTFQTSKTGLSKSELITCELPAGSRGIIFEIQSLRNSEIVQYGPKNGFIKVKFGKNNLPLIEEGPCEHRIFKISVLKLIELAPSAFDWIDKLFYTQKHAQPPFLSVIRKGKNLKLNIGRKVIIEANTFNLPSKSIKNISKFEGKLPMSSLCPNNYYETLSSIEGFSPDKKIVLLKNPKLSCLGPRSLYTLSVNKLVESIEKTGVLNLRQNWLEKDASFVIPETKGVTGSTVVRYGNIMGVNGLQLDESSLKGRWVLKLSSENQKKLNLSLSQNIWENERVRADIFSKFTCTLKGVFYKADEHEDSGYVLIYYKKSFFSRCKSGFFTYEGSWSDFIQKEDMK